MVRQKILTGFLKKTNANAVVVGKEIISNDRGNRGVASKIGGKKGARDHEQHQCCWLPAFETHFLKRPKTGYAPSIWSLLGFNRYGGWSEFVHKRNNRKLIGRHVLKI